MTKKGREFNEIYDLTAMRVIVESVKDCYGAVGVIHSLWKPLPGRFKDMIAMPKFNMYQALHTTVIGPEGRPLEIQIRTRDMHETAEYGVAAHWRYKEGARGNGVIDPTDAKLKWLKSLLDWQSDVEDPQEFADNLRGELVEEEVFVFTPKGEVKSLGAGATPLDFAYEVHTDVGHRCVGAKVNGKIVPLHYELQSGDIVEVLTSKRERGPSRDWLAVVKTTRARNKIRAWFKAESREDSEHTGRELLQEHLKKAGLPAQKIAGSALLADVIREMGFRKADDFYIALGGAKISPKVVVNKVMQRLKEGEAAEDEPTVAEDLVSARKAPRRPEGDASKYGIRVEGVEDVPLRLAKCCRPVSGDEIVGYVSLGRGITIHREDCPNAARAAQGPGAVRPGQLGRRLGHLVQGRAAGRRLGPPPAARGPLAHVRRGRHQHRRGALHRHPPDGQEPLRGRGGGHPHAEGDDHAPALDRRRVRRLPRHADRRLSCVRQRTLALGSWEMAHGAASGAARPRAALLRLHGGHGRAAAPARRCRGPTVTVIFSFGPQMRRGRRALRLVRRRRSTTAYADTRHAGRPARARAQALAARRARRLLGVPARRAARRGPCRSTPCWTAGDADSSELAGGAGLGRRASPCSTPSCARRLVARAGGRIPTVRAAWRGWSPRAAAWRSRALAAELGWSRRHFGERFREHVGAGAEARCARLLRFAPRARADRAPAAQRARRRSRSPAATTTRRTSTASCARSPARRPARCAPPPSRGPAARRGGR